MSLWPYTQVQRSICTSEPLRASIKISLDLALLRHSSPSFGSQQARSHSNHSSGEQAVGVRCHSLNMTALTFITITWSTREPCACVRLLGPCFKTGRWGGFGRGPFITSRRLGLTFYFRSDVNNFVKT